MQQIVLELDQLDYDAIQKAVARRQTFRIMPDGDEGNLVGRTVAEICRGWLDFMDHTPATHWLGLDTPDSESYDPEDDRHGDQDEWDD